MRPSRTNRASPGSIVWLVALIALACAWPGPSRAEPIPISWTDAHDHVGETVTIEGRITATHSSPLSTLLSFDSSFDRFTAVIRPADLAAFPPKPDEFYRNKLVSIRGKVVEYENKAEIVLSSPTQIRVIEPTVKPAEVLRREEEAREEVREQMDHLEDLTLELLRRMTAIEESLADVADRLELVAEALQRPEAPESPAVYFMPGYIPSPEQPHRPVTETLRSIKQGMKAQTVERLLGPPVIVDPNSEGGEIWYYGSNQSITFNSRGRVESMTGFTR